LIPKTVRIGGYTVKVLFAKNTMTDEDKCGYYNSRTKTIAIDPELCEEFQYGVFYHELIEAIKDIYHIQCLKDDHQAINQLGEAFHQLLRDNGSVILP